MFFTFCIRNQNELLRNKNAVRTAGAGRQAVVARPYCRRTVVVPFTHTHAVVVSIDSLDSLTDASLDSLRRRVHCLTLEHSDVPWMLIDKCAPVLRWQPSRNVCRCVGSNYTDTFSHLSGHFPADAGTCQGQQGNNYKRPAAQPATFGNCCLARALFRESPSGDRESPGRVSRALWGHSRPKRVV